MKTPTVDQWQQVVDSLRSAGPAGLTTTELMQRLGMDYLARGPRLNALSIVKRLILAGKAVEAGTRLVSGLGGRLGRAPVFQLKEPAGLRPKSSHD